MIINFLGDGSFKIQTGGLTILTEPFSGELSGRLKPDIIIKTRTPAVPKPYILNPTPFVIEGPGEYEIKGITILGLPGGSYLLKSEEMTLGFVGPAKNPELPATSVIDILFIPAGDAALKTIKHLEPKIVVPSAGPVKDLMEELDQKVTPQEKLVIKKKELPAEGTKLVYLAVA